jgi:hypothetical protein
MGQAIRFVSHLGQLDEMLLQAEGVLSRVLFVRRLHPVVSDHFCALVALRHHVATWLLELLNWLPT